MAHRRRESSERGDSASEMRRRPRRRHSRKRRPLTPGERAYRAAKVRANKRMSLLLHKIVYGSTLFIILVASRSLRVTLIVATCWGMGLLFHHLLLFGLPGLRQRWIDEELGREVRPAVDEERRIVEERKVRSLEDLSASIAHEIRNPVTAAKSLVQQMGEDPTAQQNIEFADVALAELDRVERSISHLLRYAREEELRFETLDVSDIVESALATFRDRLSREGVRVERDLGSAGFVRGDGEKLRRVAINLIANALDAMAGAEVAAPTLWISAGENLAGTEAWIRVGDNGPGMDDATQRKIFDPFYTTKDAGTGLGLAITKKTIEAHGGTIEVQSRSGQGTELVVAFPRDPEPEGAAR